MTKKTQTVAQEILNVIPLVMRKLNTELRQKNFHTKKPTLSLAHYSIMRIISKHP